MNAPDRPALRAGPGALRAARRLHLLLVGLRRRRPEGEHRQPAAAARGAADQARRHPAADGSVIARSIPEGRARTRSTCAATRRAPSSAIRSATTSSRGPGRFELSDNDVLVGDKTEFLSILDQLQGHAAGGRQRHLTLDPAAQRVAAEELGGPARLGGGDRPSTPARSG